MLRFATALLLFTTMDGAPSGDEFFDGKSLAGWEGLTQYWSVNNGAIVGATPGKGLAFNTFLCSRKPYRDFELRFEVRLRDGQGNSGVQIRSAVIDRKTMEVKGPQCDVGTGYWGDLYGEHMGGMMQPAPKDRVKEVVKLADFNDYFIRCVGKHVTITINGTTMVDAEFPTVPDEGVIGFQLHSGGPTEVVFRNLQFKELKK